MPRTPRRSRTPRLATLLVTLPLLVVPAAAQVAGSAPAAAAAPCASGRPQATLRDTTGDGTRGTDITAAGLWRKSDDRCVWTTAVGRFTAENAQVVQVLYDTSRWREGAEFYAFAYSNKDGDDRRGGYLFGVVDGRFQQLDCPVSSSFGIYSHQIGLGVPKSCLGDPSGVRVKVQVWDVLAYYSGNRWSGRADQVPDNRWSQRF